MIPYLGVDFGGKMGVEEIFAEKLRVSAARFSDFTPTLLPKTQSAVFRTNRSPDSQTLRKSEGSS